MTDPEPNMNERAEEAFAERTLLGVTDEEWHSAMGHVCAMAANGSKLGASILLIKAVREAVRQEREACESIAISWSDKSYEAEQIAAEIRARSEQGGEG